MPRSVPEWRGKTDNSKVPPRVRLRVFERHHGICHLSGLKIMPGDRWEIEHVIALCNGGTHSEDNMAPALVGPHKIKTAEDVKQKAKNGRVRRRHLGIRPKSRFACSKDSPWKKKISGEVIRRES